MESVDRFASAADYNACRALHRRYGTTYYFASLRFPPAIRQRTNAVYAFVRTPDEWVDNPSREFQIDPLAKLGQYRRELKQGCEGVCPSFPALRAFCDVIHETGLRLDEPLLFLDAMEQDLTVHRYRTFEELRDYMRGSAGSVGIMMCSVMGVGEDPDLIACAKLLGEAMQLTNFLRDVGEDAHRGRIYIPLEDLDSFGVTEEEILQGRLSDRFISLMKFEIERARVLYALSDDGIEALPRSMRKAVRLARVLYSRILDRIERRGYDVFGGRAHTTPAEKLTVAARVIAGLG